MWNWLNDHSGAISALASLATLLIWAVYLQLLFGSYREGRRAKILINRGAAPTLDGHCLVANMSARPIHIDAVLLDFTVDGDTGQQNHRYSLSNLNFENGEGGDPRTRLFQGPLDSGEHLDIGTFRTLIAKMSPPGFDDFRSIQSFRITIVATYTSEDLPTAAERAFDIIAAEHDILVAPRTYSARQLRSRRARRDIEKDMRAMHRLEHGNDGDAGNIATMRN